MAAFVGFGFGAIQAGLFLHAAARSAGFDRLVVAEVRADRIDAVRRAGGYITVNIAHADGVEQAVIGPVEIGDPGVEEDRAALIAAVAAASEAATALPSIDFYDGDGPGTVHRILAAGIVAKQRTDGPPLTIYAAENYPQAALVLQDLVAGDLSPTHVDAWLAHVVFADTVIAKMSGVVPVTPGLAPITPGGAEAFLVEAFDRILTNAPDVAPDGIDMKRALTRLVVKPELAPFEAAKLFCHNGGHAVAGFLGRQAGLVTMDQLTDHPELLAVVRHAMVDEAGAALVTRYVGVDPLFTPHGMAAYADDLLARMVNPYLRDAIARVTRDPARKLGWDDRLIGAMRLAHTAGIAPVGLASGAAAALVAYAEEHAGVVATPEALRRLWPLNVPDAQADAILRIVAGTLKK